MTISLSVVSDSLQMVFRKDKEDRGREEAAPAGERARRLPHQGQREQEERLLPLR